MTHPTVFRMRGGDIVYPCPLFYLESSTFQTLRFTCARSREVLEQGRDVLQISFFMCTLGFHFYLQGLTIKKPVATFIAVFSPDTQMLLIQKCLEGACLLLQVGLPSINTVIQVIFCTLAPCLKELQSPSGMFIAKSFCIFLL